MRYFIRYIGEKDMSLRRLDMDVSPPIIERWDSSGKWVFASSTLDAVSGYASDADSYHEVSEAEAEEYRKNFKKET
jgi:hypothetical protein